MWPLPFRFSDQDYVSACTQLFEGFQVLAAVVMNSFIF
jgi:hypothetical protein